MNTRLIRIQIDGRWYNGLIVDTDESNSSCVLIEGQMWTICEDTWTVMWSPLDEELVGVECLLFELTPDEIDNAVDSTPRTTPTLT